MFLVTDRQDLKAAALFDGIKYPELLESQFPGSERVWPQPFFLPCFDFGIDSEMSQYAGDDDPLLAGLEIINIGLGTLG